MLTFFLFFLLFHLLGTKSKIYSNENCFCLNPIQAIFTVLACNKGRTDTIALITNKADAQNILKLLLKIKNVLDNSIEKNENNNSNSNSNNNANKNSPKKKKIKKLNPLTNNLSLFLEYDADRMYIPSIQRKLKANHIDIIFNRAKTEIGNLLSYMDFIELLRLIADAQYNSNSSSGDKNNEEISNIEEANQVNTSTSTTTAVINNTTTNTTATTATITTANKKHRNNNNLTLEKLKCNPKQLFAPTTTTNNATTTNTTTSTTTTPTTTTTPDYRMALVLNIISSLRYEDFMSSILDWLHKESIARVNYFIIKIQSQIRKYFTKKIIIKLKKEKNDNLINNKQYKYVIKIQSLLRMFIYRYRLARLAQKTIIQYNPYFSEIYWYNPYTKVRTYNKPKGKNSFFYFYYFYI